MYSYKSGIPQIDQATGGFDAGTNLLILAPSLSYAEQLAYALTKPLPGEYAIMLSTNERASEVIDQFRAAGSDKHFIGVIDAITKSSTPSVTDTERLMFVTNPTDLTGIGIKFSHMVETIFDGTFSGDASGLFPPPIRFCIDSVSTMLMYRKLEVLYQFLHVMTAKLKKMEGFGIYILNNEAFDEKTLSLIKQLMTIVIEVKVERSDNYFRVMGIRDVNADWHKFTVNKGQVVLAL
ncbi:RAD55 family ATPase [Methanoregula sp.]|uniref:RAD55 family ATPase n=1 Tax=Methanoregula sp. TaxID=2052170 RepID=UPI0035656969